MNNEVKLYSLLNDQILFDTDFCHRQSYTFVISEYYFYILLIYEFTA